MKNISKMKEDLMNLSLPIGLEIVEATPELPILYANEMFIQMLGFDKIEDFLAAYEGSAWNCVYPADVARLKEAIPTQIGRFEPYEIIYRAVKKDGSFVWVSQNSRHTLDENGREVIFAYYTDITAQKQMEATIRAGAKKYETLIHSIPGGVGMYRLDAGFTPLFISDRVYELCGMTKAEYCEATRGSTLDVFHPDDRQGLIAAVQSACVEKSKFTYTHRVLQKDGSYRWMRVSGRVVAGEDGIPILYTVFTDVHEQIQAEQALRESELRYATAVKASNINIWEYDYEADLLTIFSKSPRIHSNGNSIQHYMDATIEGKHIREDCAATLADVIQKMKNGEQELTMDLWLRIQPEEEYWCERITCTNLFNHSGKPIKAYCVGRDVTREKETEKRYRDELSYREAMQKATMASINMNLTQNTILDHKSNFPEVAAHMSAAKTAQAYFDEVCSELTTQEMQERHAAVFNRDALLKRFANGETSLSMEFTRRIEGRRYWVVVTAHMMKRPEDGDIVAFFYSTNVTNERTMQNVMNAIVKTDYDFLVVVDAMRNSAVRYSKKNLENDYTDESENFERETREYACRYICPEDSARIVKEISIQNILTQLNAHETYNIFYAMPNPEGGILKKQLRFTYINRELKSFLMTRTDITAAVEEQEKKNKELVTAVEMAERANAAKSEFLSRVSHEIRTPMNAIMGMNQLAAQRLDDQAFVGECIKKSQYASEYLLQLLNDILDMSKIESGKVTLKKETIVCQRFLDAIATIIGSQAMEKGVNYVVTQFAGCHNSYVGDGVRLQQILINILTNAVKFTPRGGTVRLDISQLDADEEKANICFRISDTGIGIGKAFLPNLFEPFSQEHIGSTSSYGGSGLGLAISKNLAQLMGGDIYVESEMEKGTTFQVKIPFGLSEDDTKSCAEKPYLKQNIPYDFSGKKILLVEDHQLNVMVAKKLLEFKNASVDVAENGEIGLRMFAAAGEHAYDAVLMDIRMPVMDGLQAAQGIRGLGSSWAKAVPIIAMSANAFDEDVMKSRNAGMDAHLAKPIDQELLYQTLHRLFNVH